MAGCCRRDTMGTDCVVSLRQPIIAMNLYGVRRYKARGAPSGNKGHEREFGTRTAGSNRRALRTRRYKTPSLVCPQLGRLGSCCFCRQRTSGHLSANRMTREMREAVLGAAEELDHILYPEWKKNRKADRACARLRGSVNKMTKGRNSSIKNCI
jgi:hypothetical protein